MAFWSFGNYNKEGKGVEKDAPEKKRFFLFWEIYFRHFWSIAGISFIYLLSCIPIVTIGPATAGYAYVMRNYSQQTHTFMLSDYWDGIKKNWKQSLLATLIFTAIFVFLAFSASFYYINREATSVFTVLFYITLVMILFAVFAVFYIYLMIVTLDLKLKYIIKNSFLLAISALKTNIFTIVFIGLIAVVMYVFYPITVILLPFEIGLIAFIICFNSFQYIQKYCIKKTDEELAKEADADTAENNEASDNELEASDEEIDE